MILESGRWNGADIANRGLGLQNSGTLCTYNSEPGVFIPISGILCTYFPMNSPERGHFLAMGENNDTNCLYFFQMDGYRRNNDTY
ncbi:hypothetical protein NYE76_33530, partial [Paenibacillus sp. FSL M7-0831]